MNNSKQILEIGDPKTAPKENSLVGREIALHIFHKCFNLRGEKNSNGFFYGLSRARSLPFPALVGDRGGVGSGGVKASTVCLGPHSEVKSRRGVIGVVRLLG